MKNTQNNIRYFVFLFRYIDDVLLLNISKNTNSIGTIDVQSVIFGNSIKNENENRLVFETVSKYIARTIFFIKQ
jgi:hypothetical protein